MEFGIKGRRALVVGLGEALGSACRSALQSEGVTVASTVGDDVDIVVAGWSPTSTGDMLAATAESISSSWASVVETVDIYRHALEAMESRGWGRLVWVGPASAKSLDSADDDLGMMVSLAMMATNKVIVGESGPSGVLANAVLHGGPANEQDVAAAVAFLCSEGAGYLAGVTITVDGGTGSAVF